MTDYDITRVRVLIVDDNHHILSLFRNVLQAFGCRDVVTASDGKTAFMTLESFEADVALVDWEMEPTNGLKLTHRIRNDPHSPNPHLPIIMVSGYSEIHRVQQARDAGVNEFLAKPVSANSIYMRIKMLIEKPRPFVMTPKFFGPDRRRNTHADYPGPERRARKGRKVLDFSDDVDEEPAPEAKTEDPPPETSESA